MSSSALSLFFFSFTHQHAVNIYIARKGQRGRRISIYREPAVPIPREVGSAARESLRRLCAGGCRKCRGKKAQRTNSGWHRLPLGRIPRDSWRAPGRKEEIYKSAAGYRGRRACPRRSQLGKSLRDHSLVPPRVHSATRRGQSRYGSWTEPRSSARHQVQMSPVLLFAPLTLPSRRTPSTS